MVHLVRWDPIEKKQEINVKNVTRLLDFISKIITSLNISITSKIPLKDFIYITGHIKNRCSFMFRD